MYWYNRRQQAYYLAMIVYGWDGGYYVVDDYGTLVPVDRPFLCPSPELDFYC